MYLCNEIKADNTNTIMLTRLRNLFQKTMAEKKVNGDMEV